MQTLDDDHVKGIFDFANFVQCNAKVYPDAFELLQDYIVYVHIKDAKHSNHQVVPAGEGDGNIKQVLQDLYDRGYEGFLSLEPHLWNYMDFSLLDSDSPGFDLPVGNTKRFAVAVKALENILKRIKV